jgi:hypothetical protein
MRWIAFVLLALVTCICHGQGTVVVLAPNRELNHEEIREAGYLSEVEVNGVTYLVDERLATNGFGDRDLMVLLASNPFKIHDLGIRQDPSGTRMSRIVRESGSDYLKRLDPDRITAMGLEVYGTFAVEYQGETANLLVPFSYFEPGRDLVAKVESQQDPEARLREELIRMEESSVDSNTSVTLMVLDESGNPLGNWFVNEELNYGAAIRTLGRQIRGEVSNALSGAFAAGSVHEAIAQGGPFKARLMQALSSKFFARLGAQTGTEEGFAESASVNFVGASIRLVVRAGSTTVTIPVTMD